ncbi:MAG: FIG00656238: hypothetical protein [uncultured Sulfurovum sp.]|uniref:Histidine kinase n=1 Tax=uncultured Sulfurovum sp. TaxID=269237 RepID=A0A6S6TE57_9BACT|nr:MAG: FIG00656238: hypothetical protein [uncultured Sulfurovum sp.]
MTIDTLIYEDTQWNIEDNIVDKNSTDIVFLFGDRETIKAKEYLAFLQERYPNAELIGCSSSGNILGEEISLAPLVGTAVSLDNGYVKVSTNIFTEEDEQKMMTKALVEGLPTEDLKHVFVLSDGLNMNGSSLAEGINEAVKNKVSSTGGLAGDGTNFEETWVIANGEVSQKRVVAVGFYGEGVVVESGCYAGWDEFGVFRKITKSTNNIVYEIDGEPALDLYKKYLGIYAKDLPGSALDFPMNIKKNDTDEAIIRTILGVDEEAKSLTFAGDVPEGYLARLMKTNIDGLIDGSEMAARQIKKINDKSALGLVVSCVGRRLVLKQLTDEELESIAETLGDNVQLVGFYSYGELAPFSSELSSCSLHNQTMTLTVIYEEEK